MNALNPSAQPVMVQANAAGSSTGCESPQFTPQLVPPTIPDHELLRPIGRGSYGEVWLARNVVGTPRAIKVVYRQAFEDSRPFEREFEGIKQFEPVSRTHPSQLNVLHIGRNDAKGYFYYVMELADDAATGKALAQGSAPGTHADLGARMEAYRPRTLKSELLHRAPLPVDECVELGLTLATALAHLHNHGLVHRDIKPSNIIYVNGQAKLADIGLVSSIDATRSYVGTLGFAPHEGPGTPRADIYSLGKVLYEAATGRDRQDFPELPSRLDGSEEARDALIELNEIILKACDSDPGCRYPSSEALHADLTSLSRGESLVQKYRSKKQLAKVAKVGMALVAVEFSLLVLYDRYDAIEAEASSAFPPAVVRRESRIPDSSTRFRTFEEALRSQALNYPTLVPGTEPGVRSFVLLKLNTRSLRWGKEYIDALRFTTPSEEGLDLAWAFMAPRVAFSWGIFPVQGQMERGFRNFWQWPATDYTNVSEPEGKWMFIQGLPGKWLEPGREYMICFKFARPKPVEVQVAMNFVPAGTASETNLVALEAALGWKDKTPDLTEPGPSRDRNK